MKYLLNDIDFFRVITLESTVLSQFVIIGGYIQWLSGILCNFYCLIIGALILFVRWHTVSRGLCFHWHMASFGIRR